MLQIRNEQLEALSTASLDRFVVAEVKRLASGNPSPTHSAEPDETWVRESIKMGKKYGIHTEEEHSRFIDLRLESDVGFPEEDDLEVLTQNHLHASQKLDELQGRRALAGKLVPSQ